MEMIQAGRLVAVNIKRDLFRDGDLELIRVMLDFL